MAVEGSLEVFRLPEILQVVSHQRKTGILTVQGEQDIVAVSFLHGQVVAADALNQTVDDQLGAVLERQGLVEQERFDEVVEASHGGEGRVLDLLVDRGLIDRRQLLAALRQQTYDMLRSLLRWDAGEFKFYSGDEVAYEEGVAPISIEELLLRSIAEDAEAGGGALPEEGVLYERVEPPPLEVRERLGPPRPGAADDGVLWVSAEEMQVWELLAAPRSVESMIDDAGLDEHKVRFAVYRFLERGVVETHDPQADDLLELEPFAEPPPLPEPTRRPPPVPAEALGPPELDYPYGDEAESEPRRLSWGPPEVWLARLLALAAAAAVAALLVVTPLDLVLPFPWSAGERAAQAEVRLEAAADTVERAARTYHLLEGRLPDSLGRLVDRDLLGDDARRGPDRLPLTYRSEGERFSLRAGDAEADGAVVTRSVAGDYLLDPSVLEVTESGDGPPLVLLD